MTEIPNARDFILSVEVHKDSIIEINARVLKIKIPIEIKTTSSPRKFLMTARVYEKQDTEELLAKTGKGSKIDLVCGTMNTGYALQINKIRIGRHEYNVTDISNL